MTTPAPGPNCALCGQPATTTVEPSRRTLARGLDPGDQSYSVTVILPDVALCDDHAEDVRRGDRLIGWCDDPQCRTFGEAGEASACGDEYKKLGVSARSRSSRH